VSPVDGVVTAVNSHVGEMAGPGQPVVSVVGTAGVYLEAMAPSRTVRDVQPGQTVSVTVDALPGRVFSGRVRSVGSVAGPDGRSFPIQIDVAAPANVLKPGGLARAAVSAEVHSDAVTAPVEAVRVDGEKTSVWVVRNGTVREVPVTIPVQDDHYSMLVGDVRSGDQVVVTAPPGVTPGDAVDARR
jgi:membrane fusion protein (multidrug efflux system)